jgi:hypothetical protein
MNLETSFKTTNPCSKRSKTYIYVRILKGMLFFPQNFEPLPLYKYWSYVLKSGARGSVVVKALSYKSEGRGIESRWGGFFSNLPNPSDRTMALGVDSASNRNEYQES